MFKKLFCAMALCLALTPLAHAHDGATGIVKERMKVMKFIAQNTKMIAPYAMGKLEMNFNAVKGSAEQISMAAKNVVGKFPKDSTSPESEAKPNIWENWEEFESLLNKLSADAAKLSAMAENKEEGLTQQFGVMTQNCKSCHTKFRQKKE